MIEKFDLAPQPPLPVAAAEDYAKAALDASRGGWPGVDEHRDIAFGPGDWQRFDLFTPTVPVEGGADVVIFFHGGGWTNGYREWCGFMAPALAARGVALAAPTYRLAPEARFPLFFEDAMQAVGAIGARVSDYGCNPRRLFLSGHSAGGHIAALIALRPDLWKRTGIGETSVRGCLPISGILDLHHPAPPPGSLEERVYLDVLAHADDDRAASPLNWLDTLSVPLALTWGEKDTERVRRSNETARIVLEGKPDCWFRTWDEDHFGTHLMLRDPSHGWYDILDEMRKGTA
ncbi:MAG: alpha/beta hydrolase [Heliomarina sp.]|uniref:alpha/beta hydrolase n=1 Tax=Heliomarina sp. TaxID=2917556 RepID=UPI00405966A2